MDTARRRAYRPRRPRPGRMRPTGDVPGEGGPARPPAAQQAVELRAKRPPQLSRASAPVKPRAATGARRANTVVPPRAPDPDDLFLEDEADAEDDIADFVAGIPGRLPLRGPSLTATSSCATSAGFVTLILLAIVAVVVGSWLTFGSGQRPVGAALHQRQPGDLRGAGQGSRRSGQLRGSRRPTTSRRWRCAARSLTAGDRTTAVNAANAYIRAGNLRPRGGGAGISHRHRPQRPRALQHAQAALSRRGLASAERDPAFAAGRAEHGRRQPCPVAPACRTPPFSHRETGVFAPKCQDTPFFCNITVFCCIFAQFAKILPAPLTNHPRRGIL